MGLTLILIRKITTLSFICLLSFFLVYSSYASVFDFDEDDFFLEALWHRVKLISKEKRPKVALVLGGGGARGISHIGVLRVIEKEHIPIDLVVGTSVGSIIGAFYCAGLSVDKIDELAKNFSFKRVSNFNSLSLINMFLNQKLLSNQKLESFINDNIGQICFNELKIPLVCIATDLNTGERILLRDGNVAFAAKASATVPGVFKPVEYKQRYLIDGGLFENIPVNVAKIFDADVIIAVSAAADITKNNVDNVFFTLVQAIYIQGQVLDQYNLEMADIVIRPDVGSLSIIDFSKSYNTINKGFIAAQNSVKNIKMVIINKTPEKYLIE
ncbi:MAG: patatin-like phospholipase family protein [Endomicrobium sp.]|nr:patatin-like phospholipase family protein [Endomicrobium sp.]